ncbi:MAG TPA: hypothetical protein VHP32_08580 [Ignavibacteria bacterium]|nr:hypothetical protein [Ignavibacteria bacterium]
MLAERLQLKPPLVVLNVAGIGEGLVLREIIPVFASKNTISNGCPLQACFAVSIVHNKA